MAIEDTLKDSAFVRRQQREDGEESTYFSSTSSSSSFSSLGVTGLTKRKKGTESYTCLFVNVPHKKVYDPNVI